MAGGEEFSHIAENIEYLFDIVRPEGPDGRRYTNDEVASAVKRQVPGLRVSGAYLSALRKGTKRNPSMKLLSALADHFGVPVSYVLSDSRDRGDLPGGRGSGARSDDDGDDGRGAGRADGDGDGGDLSGSEIMMARLARNRGVRNLAFRALELSPEGLATVTRIVEEVLEKDADGT